MYNVTLLTEPLGLPKTSGLWIALLSGLKTWCEFKCVLKRKKKSGAVHTKVVAWTEICDSKCHSSLV